jgi:hypothetical protein
VRWTAGGNKVEYNGNVTTQTANIQTAKCLFKSLVSTPNGRFMTLDLKDFYLCSDLPDYENVRIPMYMIPPAIVRLYKLKNKFLTVTSTQRSAKECTASPRQASSPMTASAHFSTHLDIYLAPSLQACGNISTAT